MSEHPIAVLVVMVKGNDGEKVQDHIWCPAETKTSLDMSIVEVDLRSWIIEWWNPDTIYVMFNGTTYPIGPHMPKTFRIPLMPDTQSAYPDTTGDSHERVDHNG